MSGTRSLLQKYEHLVWFGIQLLVFPHCECAFLSKDVVPSMNTVSFSHKYHHQRDG
jgi:hypothetical protein